MEEILIFGLLFLLGGEESSSNGKTGPDDWAYDYGEWSKVAQGFSAQLAWRVYKHKSGDFELAFKTPEGLLSEGPFATEGAAKARGIELGKAPD